MCPGRSSWFCSAYSDLRPIDDAHHSCSVGFLRAGSEPTTKLCQVSHHVWQCILCLFSSKTLLLTSFLFSMLCRDLGSGTCVAVCLAEFENRIHKLTMSKRIYLCLLKEFIKFIPLCVRYSFTNCGNDVTRTLLSTFTVSCTRAGFNLLHYCTVYRSIVCKISGSKLRNPLTLGIVLKQNKRVPGILTLQSSPSMYKTRGQM